MLKRIGTLFWFWIPVFLWMGMIFYSSSIGGDQMPKFDIPYIDKLFHFIEYLVLGFLLARALFSSSTNPSYKYIFIASIAISLLYGASDELHQYFVAGRNCDIIDMISDLVGSILGAGLFLYKEKVRSAVDKTV